MFNNITQKSTKISYVMAIFGATLVASVLTLKIISSSNNQKTIYWEQNLNQNCLDKNICANISRDFSDYRWATSDQKKETKDKYDKIFGEYCWQTKHNFDKDNWTLTTKVRISPDELHCQWNKL